MKLIIDAHLDLAWNALAWKRDITLPLLELNRQDAARNDHPARGRATTSLPELRRAGVAVCLATFLARAPRGEPSGVHGERLDFPSQDVACAVARGQLAYYRRLEARGEVTLIGTASELDAHWQRWEQAPAEDRARLPVGFILAMEGCDPMVEPSQAQEWFADGLRSAGLVHYGRSAYAVGTGDDGPLTPRGRELLKKFSQLGIILDVTHLSDRSFFEAMDAYDGPVLASHQNCRSLVPGGRQFTDEQIKLVIERQGILGVAYDAWMLYPGWVRGETFEQRTPREVVRIEASADHIDHVCQLAGNCRHIALGSDLDGGFGTEQTPVDLDSIADLQKMDTILAARGYSQEDIKAVFHGNWLNFFRKHLPEQ